MKSLEIGKIKVKLAETLEDLNINRWTAIQIYAQEVESGIDLPSLQDMFFNRFTPEFNRVNAGGMYIALFDFLKSYENLTTENADQMVFALITLEEGEEPSSTDNTMLQEKLARYAKEGLNQGLVKRTITDFITGLNIR